jgi:two-component system, NtrC family, nitrogen regulation response regulator GlnG
MMQHNFSHVAIIDDDTRVLEALENLFISVGLNSLLYRSAEEFFASDSEERIVCVVSDIEMPGMNGLELMIRVRSSSPEMPIILMSAHHELDDTALYTDLGANRYFAKPFDCEELLAAVRSVVPEAI